MDTNIVYFFVTVPLLLGGILWLVVYSRKQSQKHTMRTSIKPPESRTEKLTS